MLFVRPTVLIECLGLSPFDPDAPPPPARPPPPRCFFAIVHVLAPLRRSSRFERSLARRRSNARVRSRLAHGLATRADVDAPRCAPLCATDGGDAATGARHSTARRVRERSRTDAVAGERTRRTKIESRASHGRRGRGAHVPHGAGAWATRRRCVPSAAGRVLRPDATETRARRGDGGRETDDDDDAFVSIAVGRGVRHHGRAEDAL